MTSATLLPPTTWHTGGWNTAMPRYMSNLNYRPANVNREMFDVERYVSVSICRQRVRSFWEQFEAAARTQFVICFGNAEARVESSVPTDWDEPIQSLQAFSIICTLRWCMSENMEVTSSEHEGAFICLFPFLLLLIDLNKPSSVSLNASVRTVTVCNLSWVIYTSLHT